VNLRGFTATVSIKELRGFRATTLESGVARASTLIEPQQIPGIFRPLSWLELRCPQATDPAPPMPRVFLASLTLVRFGSVTKTRHCLADLAANFSVT
jgi:hypothetical protein